MWLQACLMRNKVWCADAIWHRHGPDIRPSEVRVASTGTLALTRLSSPMWTGREFGVLLALLSAPRCQPRYSLCTIRRVHRVYKS